MRKFVIVLIVAAVTFTMLYFTGILSDIRAALFNGYEQVEPESKVFYLRADRAEEDPNSAALLAEADRRFVAVRALRAGDVSAMYFEREGILMIQTLEDRIVIAESGAVEVGGTVIPQRVELRRFGGDLYVSAADLGAFAAGARIGIGTHYREGRSMLVTHDRISYPRASAADPETRLFPSVKWVVEDETVEQSMLSFGDKTPFHGMIEAEGYLYVVTGENGDEFGLYFAEEGVYGYARLSRFSPVRRTAARRPDVHALDHASREKLVMTWEAVYGRNPDVDTIPAMPGLNAVSPTWYALDGSEGAVTELVGPVYAEWARSRGYELWPLIKNDFGDIGATSRFLSSLPAQERVIRYIVDEAVRRSYDGINVDFEHIYLRDRDALTHFVNMLAFDLRKWNIPLSMDVTVTGGADNWSRCYDHEALGRIVDYLVIMTYDEHYASSPVAGPVSSFRWMKHHMEILARIVEPHKLILGLPFYTRIWEEKTSASNPNDVELTTKAVTMREQESFMQSKSFETVWDEQLGVYYATAFDGPVQYKIWVENAESIALKLTLVDALGLGGVSGWRRGYETEDIWLLLEGLNR